MTYVVENSWSQPFKKSVKLRNNLMFIHWHISQNAPTMSHIVKKKSSCYRRWGSNPGPRNLQSNTLPMRHSLCLDCVGQINYLF